MSLVAAETALQTAPPAKSKETETWEEIPLFMPHLGRIRHEALVDVVKMHTRSSKIKNVLIPSLSNETMSVKDALNKDQHNLRLINNLAFHYLREGQHDMGLNVLMRGFKRAGEIPSEKGRFRFLMKTCELSFGLWKFRQALTVFRDITEPVDEKLKKRYLLLGTQVWSANGDLEQGLKHFQRCIDGQDFVMSSRLLALVCLDLKKAGAFEAAKSTLENLAGEGRQPELMMLSEYVDSAGDNRKAVTSSMNEQRNLIIAGVVAGAVFFTLLLYWLESKSLAAMTWTPPSSR